MLIDLLSVFGFRVGRVVVIKEEMYRLVIGCWVDSVLKGGVRGWLGYWVVVVVMGVSEEGCVER